jgi:8-oxo-dGTP pyrophosphatase MutT (NUDIX family)
VAVTPVPAATIMLLRESASTPEVLMLERHAKSEFLPELYVFPGGRVDPGDHELVDRVSGLTREQASALAPTVPPEQALAFFVAAIRETFEEAGVLLARRRGESSLISGELAAELSQHRLDMQGGGTALCDLAAEHDLELAVDSLTVHGHWITPEIVPKRFDTLFFCAAAPADHLASHDGVESTDHVWIRPEDAIAQADSGERQMIFPTIANLQTIAGHPNVGAVLESSHARPVVPVLPTVRRDGDARRLVIPPEAGYELSDEILTLPKPGGDRPKREKSERQEKQEPK